MKYLGITFGLLIASLAALLFIVPSLIPSEAYKTRIEDQLSRELDRDITIDGEVSLLTFPVIRAKTGGLTISNPDGFERDTLATIQSLEARIKLLPLLSRRVEIASFTLVEPDIWLERRSDGVANWQFGTGEEESTPQANTEPFQRDGRYDTVDPSLGSLRIEQGRLTYVDHVASVRRNLSDMNVRLALPAMTEAFNLDGTMVLDDEPVEIILELDSPRAFLDGAQTELQANISISGLTASANGTIPAGLGLGFDGTVRGDITDFELIGTLLPDPIPGLETLERVRISADLSQTDAESVLTVNNLDVNAEGNGLTASLSGNYTLLDGKASGTGALNADISDAGPTLRAFLLDLPTELDLAGQVTTQAKVSLQDNEVSLESLIAKTQGDGVESQFDGGLTFRGNQIGLNGRLSAAIDSLSNINETLAEPIPYASLIETIALSTSVSGDLDDLAINDLTLQLSDGDLNGSYIGSATLSDTLALSGKLDVTSPSIRQIAIASGTDLPPTKGDQSIFEAFALSGDVSGSTQNMTLTNAALSLDKLQATGQFGIELNGARPKLTGLMEADTLDLRPYMEAYSTEPTSGEMPPWSTEPIPIEGLSAIDADFKLSANSIHLSQLSLGVTEADVDLNNGQLKITVPNVTLYGGQGEGLFVLDGSGSTPSIEITAGLNRLQSNGFLNALVGFARASGTGQTQVSLTGSGISQAAIMNSLNGQGSFGVSNGAVNGIDAGKFLTGLQSALTSRSLPAGVGPLEKTEFKDLVGGFTLENGVAQIQSFSLSGPQVQMDGSGKVDLGNQTVDISLQPKAVGSQAKGLAAFGIPLKVSGPFGASKVTLDSAGLSQLMQARAAEEARNAITDRVGGPAGNLIGSILGDQPSQTTAESENDTKDDEEKTEEESPEDAIENGLRQLFGVRRRD